MPPAVVGRVSEFNSCSDKERLLRDGPPAVESMFNGEGGAEHAVLKLKQCIRTRGYGKWFSVATSMDGSFRAHDIFNFLETRPPNSTSRRPAVAGLAHHVGVRRGRPQSRSCLSFVGADVTLRS